MAEYILVIHGTFNAPDDGPPKWFQLNPQDKQNFCHRLNQALATTPLQDAVWRQCPGINVEFHWSGDNTHGAREDGAKKLCDLLVAIRYSDPEARIHLIAHSHGGNVVLRAIELYFEKLQKEAGDIADQSHRLGRLVFMGTPFYYKRWLRGSRLSSDVALLRDVLLGVPFDGVQLYCKILVLAGVLSVLPWINFVGFNPLEWPVWLLVVSGVFLAISTGLILISKEEYRDVNMYYIMASFNQPERTLDNNVQKAPLDALVLSAGVLDEALIGLSIEPLVFGFLSPELKKRLTPSFLSSLLRLPRSRSGSSGMDKHEMLLYEFHRYSAPVTAFLVRATRWWTEPRLTELILDLACAAGFGLPIDEFSNSLVTPQKELKVPGVFDAGEVVDVTKLFAMTRLTPRSPATLVPFDFLWDDVKLDKEIGKLLHLEEGAR